VAYTVVCGVRDVLICRVRDVFICGIHVGESGEGYLTEIGNSGLYHES